MQEVCFFWGSLHCNICFAWEFGLRHKLITSSYLFSSYHNRGRFRAKKWNIMPCWILWHTFVIVISKMMNCFSQTYPLCNNVVIHKLWSINLHIKLRSSWKRMIYCYMNQTSLHCYLLKCNLKNVKFLTSW